MREEIKSFTGLNIVTVRSSDHKQQLVELQHMAGCMAFVFAMTTDDAERMARALMEAANELTEVTA